MPRISHYIRNTKVLGPGDRFCIWFQGCKKRCDGCINIEGQALNNGIQISNEILLEKIKNENSITGVTISGGEPFLQKNELLDLVFRIKKETKLDVMVYTGYKYDELINDHICREILENIDILVDGEYKKDLNNNELYRGSSNQKIYILTEKYKSFEEKINNSKSRSIEFQTTEEDELVMIGIPPKDFYEQFSNIIREEV